MWTSTLSRTGGPTDAAWLRGDLYLCWQAGTYVEVGVYRDGVRVAGSLLPCSDGAFPRLLAADGAWHLAFRGPDEYLHLYRDGVRVWQSPVRAGGNDCCCLGYDEDVRASLAWQAEGTNAITAQWLSNPATNWQAGIGRPTGLSRFSDTGRVMTVDEDRVAFGGLTRPSLAGGLVCGEAPAGGVLVRTADGATRELLLWPGTETFVPRIACDPVMGRYAVVTHGRDGVRVATFTEADLRDPLPLPEPDSVPPGPAWRPVIDPPPVNIVDALLGASWSRGAATLPTTTPPRCYVHPFQSRRETAADGTGWAQHTKFGPSDTRAATWTYTRDWVGLASDGTNEILGGYRLVLPGTDTTAALYPRVMRAGAEHRHRLGVEVLHLATGQRDPVLFEGWVESVWELLQPMGDFAAGTRHAVIVFAVGTTNPRHWREDNYCTLSAPGGCWAWDREKVATGVVDVRWMGTRTTPRIADPPALFSHKLPVHPEPEPDPMPTILPLDQFMRDMKAVSDFYASPEGLKRPGGLVIDTAVPVEFDVQAFRWAHDLASGVPLATILARIRRSDEWKTKHAGDPVPPPPPPSEDRLVGALWVSS